ncbi:PfkB family carbohydrate kinase [Aggregatilinea lenta]|uniref:PfkB family carbohydrate kinase n=1 Tax=Aggregatilinea lenta TaxID=913108 RepID=UPI000E5ADDE8|nr:PfkB family carbohydrate kinase [Aggregatilinea lenta]
MINPDSFIPDYLLIGHIAHDVTPNGPMLGGTVSYAAQMALAFGLRVAILTSSAKAEPLLADLPPAAAVLSTPAEHTTTFDNRYTGSSRIQYLYHRANTLHPGLLPPAWRGAPLVHLAPIAYEVDPAFMTAFDGARVCVTPQGWMRQREADGRVTAIPWTSAPDILPRAALTVMSEEDIRHLPGAAQAFANLAPLMVVTRAEHGGTIYESGVARDFAAYPVEQIEPTGAGDIFATALHIALAQTGDLDRAIRAATYLAGLSVTRVGRDSVPTPDETAQALAL